MKINESGKIEQDLQKFGQALQCTLATKLKGWDNIHALAREIREMDGIDVDSKCIELGFGSFAELLQSPKMAKFVVAINQQWPAPVVYKAKVDEATRGVMEMQREFEVYRQKKEQRRERWLAATPSTALASSLNQKSREEMYQRPISNSDGEQKVNRSVEDKSQKWPIVIETPSRIMLGNKEEEWKRKIEEEKKWLDEEKKKEFGNDHQPASRRVTFSLPAFSANPSRLDNKALSYLQTPTMIIAVLLLIAIALLLSSAVSNKKDSINMTSDGDFIPNNNMTNEQMVEELKRKLASEVKKREKAEEIIKSEEEKKRKEEEEKSKQEEEERGLRRKFIHLGFACAGFFGLCHAVSDQVALSFIVGVIFGSSFIFTSLYGFSSLFSLLFSIFLSFSLGIIGLLFLSGLAVTVKKILKKNKRKETNDFKSSGSES